MIAFDTLISEIDCVELKSVKASNYLPPWTEYYFKHIEIGKINRKTFDVSNVE